MNIKLIPIERNCLSIEHHRENWHTIKVSKRNTITVENHLKNIQATFTTSFNRYGDVVFEVYL
ncbi:hypothetical protein [uncultured Methanobrevibacter sp.]|uniref:hypothetical protein n=1 Tax=uncultured Methanobrevibacter sp. TaxID=253161 RepID=UPI0025EE886C|nr:hypothetical protein [uncultured Methanobrevibacter sp.]